ncbi:MAG: RNA 2',3'-cyclic phosphodiesterase, partial [Halioglobus sp.]|nr:RNA 2',3'-cyclic phosphodiesterase [Halioglobus sp.]
MRLFFALEAEPETALAIANWRDASLLTDGRPVPAANFHITLAFVGATPHAKSERLANAVDDWVVQATPASGSLV